MRNSRAWLCCSGCETGLAAYGRVRDVATMHGEVVVGTEGSVEPVQLAARLGRAGPVGLPGVFEKACSHSGA
jgi:hypothetical protein